MWLMSDIIYIILFVFGTTNIYECIRTPICYMCCLYACGTYTQVDES